MSKWLSPDVEALREVISTSKGQLLLCSPYVSTPALRVAANALPNKVSAIEFLSFSRSRRSNLAKEILRIATNADSNNNTGKVKQTFFGVQRFLQEHPQHRPTVENLPFDWFDIRQSDMSSDCVHFLDQFSNEVDPSYQYSISTLCGYLPVADGGTLVGGGGGSNELKRVWPFVGRALRAFNR